MQSEPTLVKELMRTDVVTVREEDTIPDVLDLLVAARLHGVPVVDGAGDLVGVVSQMDVFFAAMTRSRSDGGPEKKGEKDDGPLLVRDVMTSPPVFATEDTDVRRLCETMYKLRLHRVPIVRGRRVIGIFSSLDVCGALAQGRKFN